jgi:GAF domain-containing protein
MHFKETQESVADSNSASQFTLLVVGLNCSLERSIFTDFRIIEVQDGDEAHRCLAIEHVDLLILGSRLTPKMALQILDRCTEARPGNSILTVVLCVDSQCDLFQTHVTEGRIFYLARTETTPQQLRSIITCAGARLQSKYENTPDPLATKVAETGELLEFCIRLQMQVDLRGAAGVLSATAHNLLNAESVRYLAYDAAEDTLTPVGAGEIEELSESAAAGLVAFVARTGEGIRLDCVDGDPRYDLEADNPDGLAGARLLAEPLIGFRTVPAGVVAVTRRSESAPFTPEDTLLLRLLLECAVPAFNQIILQSRVQALLLKRTESIGRNSDVFREEALEHHIRSWDQQGEVLKGLPPWLRITYWGMLLLVLAGLLGTALVKVNTYVSGPAVIRTKSSPLQDTGVIALLPEADASRILPGMSMRLRTERTSSFVIALRISQVGPEVMDPTAAVQYAGKVDDKTFRVAGRVIAVRATLPPADSGKLVYRDGASGEAQVRVRSEPVLFVLIPSLRKIFGQVDEF